VIAALSGNVYAYFLDSFLYTEIRPFFPLDANTDAWADGLMMA